MTRTLVVPQLIFQLRGAGLAGAALSATGDDMNWCRTGYPLEALQSEVLAGLVGADHVPVQQGPAR